MRNDILHTIQYFAFFQYPPTFEELYIFNRKETTTTQLKAVLNTLIQEGSVISYKYERKNNGIFRYTARGYEHFFKIKTDRYNNTKQKIITLLTFVNNTKFLPGIQLIGLSGSMSMSNCSYDDDIDLFIIAASHRLWTARFFLVLLAHGMGVRRKRTDKHAKNKICLNLFFDETDLKLPIYKRTEYAAHEVLQMKPLMSRSCTYMRFLDANRWIFDIFPNARKRHVAPLIERASWKNIFTMPGNILEHVLKYLQLAIMSREKKDEHITTTQLWFFPEDFEKKLKG